MCIELKSHYDIFLGLTLSCSKITEQPFDVNYF